MTAPGSTVDRCPGAVRWITRTLEDAGYETWAVGGAVRDALLGLPGTDWDLTTAATPGRVRSLFPRTVPIGIEHGTVGVLARDGTLYEVTTFRKDVETDGRHAVVVFADTVDEDLARRDFTINAVAWHALRNELRDPFNGVADLGSRVLRTVGVPGERFAEDHLRILRALRFAARFDLVIDPDTWAALVAARAQLPHLSPERVRDELLKILALPRASTGVSLYADAGVLEILMPALEAVRHLNPGAPDDPWVRSLGVVDSLSPARPLERLGALMADLGTPGPGDACPPGADGHSGRTGPAVDVPDPVVRRRRGVARALALLEGLRFSNAQIREVSALVDAAAFPPAPDSTPSERRRWLADVGRDPFPGLFRVWLAGARVDARRRQRDPAPVLDRIRRLRSDLRGGTPLSVDDLALDGRDLIALGFRPGRHFGTLLRHLLDRTLEDPSRNRREWLEEEAVRWMSRRDR